MVSPRRAARRGLPASWSVHLPIFEGPLDLLLHLVRINEVEITDIPVAAVCDQFHDYLELMEELDLDIAAEYVYEAAQLIHLKSKLLLPRRPEGEEESEDPRRELVERLLEYRRIKEAAQSLGEVHRLRSGIWTRPPQDPEPEGEPELDLGEVSLFDLLGALRKVLRRYDREHPPALRLGGQVFSLRSQVERLLEALSAGRPVDFVDDLSRLSGRAEAVAAFLAVLELARLSLVRIHQGENGGFLLYRTEREMSAEEMEAIQG